MPESESTQLWQQDRRKKSASPSPSSSSAGSEGNAMVLFKKLRGYKSMTRPQWEEASKLV